MEILNLGGNSQDSGAPVNAKQKKHKVAKAAVGIGALASLTGLGSTLAANINLNNDANVEFGQGVAQTAACDEDGFTITPVSYYDADASTFRLDYVEVSGLNLIPTGADESTASGSGWQINYSSYSDASAIAEHPGQYYSVDNVWTNTCDGVVLDFKAYTDSMTFASNTLDGYAQAEDQSDDTVANTISSPLFWTVEGHGGVARYGYTAANSDIAIVFDSTNDSGSYSSNIGAQNNQYYALNRLNLLNYVTPATYDATGFSPTGFTANSAFQFFTTQGHHSANITFGGGWDNDPVAGAISKITVESMKYFPSDYLVPNGSGPGVRP